jgi:hypothetical protein
MGKLVEVLRPCFCTLKATTSIILQAVILMSISTPLKSIKITISRIFVRNTENPGKSALVYRL